MIQQVPSEEEVDALRQRVLKAHEALDVAREREQELIRNRSDVAPEGQQPFDEWRVQKGVVLRAQFEWQQAIKALASALEQSDKAKQPSENEPE